MRFLFAIAVFALLLPSVVMAQTSSGVGIEVLKHDPAPAEAGKFLELWISIDKRGTFNLNNHIIEIVPGFPFSLASDESPTKEFAVIDTNGAVARFKLSVAENAPNGDATLKVRNYPKGSPTTAAQELTIPILGKVDIEIASVSTDTLIPGQPIDVKFIFENSGNAPVRDLIIKWNDPEGGILPLAGENRFRIDNLEIGESREVEFRMIADPKIEQGVQVINIDMEFQRFGTSDNRTSQVAFIVGGLTDFDVAQDEIEDGSLSLSVANIGVNSATGVLLSVPEQEGWQITGGSNVFLGNLESGDFTVASVDLVPLSNDLTQKLKVKVDYTDTVGIRQSIEKDVVINLSNLLESKKGDQDFTLYYVIIAVIIIAAFWYTNRRFKILKKIMDRK